LLVASDTPGHRNNRNGLLKAKCNFLLTHNGFLSGSPKNLSVDHRVGWIILSPPSSRLGSTPLGAQRTGIGVETVLGLLHLTGLLIDSETDCLLFLAYRLSTLFLSLI